MRRVLLLALLSVAAFSTALPQRVPTYRTAIVALVDDPALRSDFEQGLAEKARRSDYDAVASTEFAPDVRDVDNRDFVTSLEENGARAVLMIRPAAVGRGASLESVRNQVDPELYDNMRAFAGEVSESGPEDLLAVAHIAIYVLPDRGRPELVSAGAVWLDEEVESRAQGIERLQDLIVANVDAARPELRRQLGLPPLE